MKNIEVGRISKTRWYHKPLLWMMKLYGTRAFFHPEADGKFCVIVDIEYLHLINLQADATRQYVYFIKEMG